MARLENKVAIITGAARGQGAAHARLFVKEGAKVVLTDLLESEGKALAKELGENAVFIKHDVTKPEDWKKVVRTAEEKFGHVNVLVNNAGIGGVSAPVDEFPENEYRKVIAVNQDSVFYGMKYTIPSMKKAGKGSIVNISSLAGLVGGHNMVAYQASKFAVRGMTKTAALELAPLGIRVNSVHPGFIETPMIRTEEANQLTDTVVPLIPMQRIADPEEVSNLILFLASDEASYSTGSEFVIDGGLGAQ